VWFEITNLIIPGWNDSEAELEAMTQWVVETLGPDVPVHFSAFHPDYKMMDVPPTPPAALTRARNIALKNGLRYAYTGNVYDRIGDTTFCHDCGEKLIERDWYELLSYRLDGDGRCLKCGSRCAGVFEKRAGRWGRRRRPVRLAQFA
jgi:pyruvate formate lyase activating enzyme